MVEDGRGDVEATKAAQHSLQLSDVLHLVGVVHSGGACERLQAGGDEGEESIGARGGLADEGSSYFEAHDAAVERWVVGRAGEVGGCGGEVALQRAKLGLGQLGVELALLARERPLVVVGSEEVCQ